LASANVTRAQQEKLALESNMRILKDQYNLLARTPAQLAGGGQVVVDRFADIDRDIETLNNQLLVLRQRYKDTYPEVQAVLERRDAALKRREEILRGTPIVPQVDNSETSTTVVSAIPVNPQAARDARELEIRIQQTDSALEAKTIEIEGIEKELKKITDQIKVYQGRLESAPAGERQYAELVRDESIAKGKWTGLQENLAKAQLSADMEGRKQGEKLELLDPASLPGTPTEPKRPVIISIGAAAGLLLGIVLAGVREVKDTTLKNLKDVRAYTEKAVLSSVPLVEAESIVRQRKRQQWLAWTAACILGVAIMGGSIAYYYLIKAA
jgi:polysaccharide biosynthesis transport protein